MADRPVITTIPSGGVYDTNTLNDNFTKLRNEFDNLLSRKGTAAANNMIEGDIDLAGNAIRNMGTISPIGGPTETVGTIDQLRVSENPDGTTVHVLGYYAAGDGGGGIFYLDTADTTSADDGGSVIVDASNNRWKRQDKESIRNVRCWGAKGDGVTNDAARFMACLQYHEDNGGGHITVPLGDYPIQLNVNVGNITITCEPGTILRAASSGSVIDVWDTLTGPFTLIDADIRGQEKAQEGVLRPPGAGAGYEDCRALHCVRVMGPNVTLIRCKAKGARYDAFYGRVRPTTNGGAANFRSISCEWGDVGRNTISLVDGHYWYFEGDTFWNEGRYWEAGQGTHSLYLFDIEPTSSEVCTHVYIRNCRFLAGSPVSGSHQFICGTPQTADNYSHVYVDNCYFGSYGTGGISDSTIRTKGDVSGNACRGVHISNSHFEGRMIANSSQSNLEDCTFTNLVMGGSPFYFASLGAGSSFEDITFLPGGAPVVPIVSGTTPTIKNVTDSTDRVTSTAVYGGLEVVGGAIRADSGIESVSSGYVGRVVFTKAGDGTIGTSVSQLVITPLGQSAFYCQVGIVSQSVGSTVARRSRGARLAFWVTRSHTGAPVIDMDTDKTFTEFLSSLPAGGDRDPGPLGIAANVVGNTVVVTIDNSVTSGSVAPAISVTAEAWGRNAFASIFS